MTDIANLAEFMNARRSRGLPRSFKAFASLVEVQAALKELRAELVSKGQVTGTNPAGGVTVNSGLVSDAAVALRDLVGVARRTCQIVPMTEDVITVPRRTGGLSANWTTEAAAITESSMTWDAITTVKKLAVLVRASTELSEDAVGLVDWLAGEIAYQLASAEDAALFNGDGSSTYAGITGVLTKLAFSSSLAGAVSAASSRTSLTSFDQADLASVVSVLPTFALRSASWFCSPPVYALIFCRLAAQNGGLPFVNGQPTFWGMPIYISAQMPTATSSLNQKIVLLVGDMSQAVTMGSRRAVTIAASRDRLFENDQILWRGTERLDIIVHDVGTTTVAGPIAALLGKT